MASSQALAALVIGIAVTALWFATVIVGIFVGDFSAAKLVTVIMSPVAAYLWGIQIIRRGNGGGGDK